jgi:hypothetical protein
MRNFPNSFADKPIAITQDLGETGNAAIKRLSERGFTVVTGLTVPYTRAIGIMGQQPHIAEYCPRDATAARFVTPETTQEWLKKGGGRAMFLLLSQVVNKQGEAAGQRLEGYGWTGLEPDEDNLPDHPITSAYRLGATALRKHLSGDFARVIIQATHALYAPADNIGLETWESNVGAVELYKKLGFVLKARSEPEPRPTLQPEDNPGVVVKDGKRFIEDVRLHMAFPSELLAA